MKSNMGHAIRRGSIATDNVYYYSIIEIPTDRFSNGCSRDPDHEDSIAFKVEFKHNTKGKHRYCKQAGG